MIARAAMHIHSDWSHDGSWPLAKLASAFGKAGYRFLFTAEHDESFDAVRWDRYQKACNEAGNGQVLIIPGIEYSDPSNIVHVLVWGDMPFLGAGIETGRLLERVSKLRGMAVLAHPSRRNAWQKFDASWVPFLLGIEQWNRKEDGLAPSDEAKILLDRAPGLVSFVGLDFHATNQFFPLAMMLRLGDGPNEKEALNALREGRFYAEVLGISLRYFAEGIGGRAAVATERFRRSLRSIVRKDITGRQPS